MSLQKMQDSKSNPYESPQGKRDARRSSRRVFLTKQRLTWIGLALIFLALGAFTLGHAVFVQSFGQNRESRTISASINVFGVLAFIAGTAALIISGRRREPRTRFRYGGQSNGAGDSNTTSDK